MNTSAVEITRNNHGTGQDEIRKFCSILKKNQIWTFPEIQ